MKAFASSNRVLSAKRSAAPSKRVVAVKAQENKGANAAVALAVGSALSAKPAFADAIDDVVKALTGAVEFGGEAVKTALPVVDAAVKEAEPVVKTAIKTAEPLVQEGIKVGSKVLTETINTATPIANKAAAEAGKAAIESLKSAGVPVDSPAVKTAVSTTSDVFSFLAKQDPLVLGEGFLVLLGAIYIGGPVLSAVGELFKGYKGDLNAPQTLDLLLSDGSAILIDLRSIREKEQTGIPDVPGAASGRFFELEFATVDKKVRGLMKDATAVECELTALQVANMKRVGGRTPIVLMDASGTVASTIAKSLSRKGFSSVYVMKNGFRNWQTSKLETRIAKTVTNPTVLLEKPSPSGTTSMNGSRPAAQSVKGVRALPPGN